MGQPYDVAGATPHDRDEWEWVPTPEPGHWKLKISESEHKSYNCTEYAMAKLFGDRAEWGGHDSRTTETDEIEAELRRRGFQRQTSATTCGCGPGQVSACAVLYFPKDENGQVGSEPYHVEVFDPRHCDWGGKSGPRGPVRRRRNPGDHPSEAEERARTQMVFYCKANHSTGYRTDASIHGRAREAASTPAPAPAPAPAPTPTPAPAAPPPPGPALTPGTSRLWLFLKWLAGGLLLLGLGYLLFFR